MPKIQKTGLSPGAKAFLLHAGVILTIIGGAYIIYRSGFMLPPCVFYSVTGYPCIACGGTRAAYSLLRLEIFKSIAYNPIPVMFALSSAGLILTEAARLIAGKKSRLPQRTVPTIVIAATAVALIFFALRCAGVFPRPEAVDALFL